MCTTQMYERVPQQHAYAPLERQAKSMYHYSNSCHELTNVYVMPL